MEMQGKLTAYLKHTGIWESSPICLFILLLILWLAAMGWSHPLVVWGAILLPPAVCLFLGRFKPAMGIILSLGLLPVFTVEAELWNGKSISTVKLLLLAIILIWIFHKKGGPLIPRAPLAPAWIAYLAVALLSMILANPSITGLWWLAESSAIFFVYLAVYDVIAAEREKSHLLDFLSFAGALVLCLWIIQRTANHWAGIVVPMVVRIGSGIQQETSLYNSASMGNPNFLGAYFLLAAGIVFGHSEKSKGLKKGTLLTVGFLMCGAHFYPGSIGSLLSLGIILFMLGIRSYFKWSRLIMAVGIGIFAFIAWNNLMLNSPPPQYRIDPNGVIIRSYALRKGFQAWTRHPLLGSGPGTFLDDLVLSEKLSGEPPPAVRLGTYSISSHNEYLKQAVELGTAGLLIFIWMLWPHFSYFWKSAGENDRWQSYLLGGLLALSFSALFENTFSYSALWALFWSVSAIALRESPGS